MRYRGIPDTTLRLSKVGFGCGGNAGLMVRGERAAQERAVARALELGINYFDTAPDYGVGRAEENLGAVLRALGQRPVITSKVEIRAHDLGDVAGHVVRSCEESLRRLGVDRLDVLQIHNGPARVRPAPQEGYRTLALQDFLEPGGALEGLLQLKSAGKIGYAGFVCRGGDGADVCTLLATGQFHLINLPYTLVNPTAGLPRGSGVIADPDYDGIINDAGHANVGTAIFSPLAGGVLTDDHLDGAPGHPLARRRDARADKTRLAARVRFLARETGLTLAQAAYRFILMHPHVTTVIGGFSSAQQVEEIAPVSGTEPFGAAHLARLDAAWRANDGTTAPAAD